MKALAETPARERNDIEEVLLARACAGETAAYETLYREHVGRVYAICLRMTGSVALAEDCTQQAFVRAWEKLGSFAGRSTFATWLHRIAVNEVLADRRRSQRRGVHLDLVEDGAHPAALRVNPQHDLGIDLDRAIAALPDGARKVLVLHTLMGYSHGEIAELLGIAVGTCKAQLHRARKLLLERMGV